MRANKQTMSLIIRRARSISKDVAVLKGTESEEREVLLVIFY